MGEGVKNNRMVESAVIGNIGHIIIGLITGGIMNFLGQFRALNFYSGSKIVFLAVIFILTLFFWFYMGIHATKYQRGNRVVTGVLTAIISIIPGAFFTILSNFFSIRIENADALTRWNHFYLAGGPTLFWHRPFSLISEILYINHQSGISSYLIFYLNLLAVGLAVYFGAIFFGGSVKRR